MSPSKQLKKQAIEYKGGKCILCGYHKCEAALCFHHVNPFEKENNISRLRSWKRVEEELNKCVLLCNNCHSELHQGFVDITILEILDPTFNRAF